MIPCCLPPLSLPLAASSPLVAPAVFVCLVGWLLRRLAASLRCIPSRRHVTSRCVSSHLVSSRLTITSCLDVASRLVLVSSSRLIASRRVASSRVASRPLYSVGCHIFALHLDVASRHHVHLCVSSLHRVLSSRPVASHRVVSLRRFVYLVVALLIPARRSPPLLHDVDVDALVADLLPPQLPPRPNAIATFSSRPTRLGACCKSKMSTQVPSTVLSQFGRG